MPPVAPSHNSRVIAILVVLILVLIIALFWVNGDALVKMWRGQTAISFETVDQGLNGFVEERKNYVISSKTEWQDLWSLIHGDRQPIPQVPSVDFSNEKILVAFQGQRPNGGYRIAFNKVIDSGDTLDVYVQEQEPGENCVTTQALTTPYHIVKIPKFSKALVSHTEHVVVDCQ